jgi:glutathione peroxidase
MKKLIGAICLMSAALFGASSVYEFTLNSIDGQPMPLQNFQGKVMLIVIVGFPANNFMGQEPGTNEEIKTFCSTKYNVKFPLYSKISVKGGDKAPLYQFLTDTTANPKTGGEIKWNFTKFLVDRNGKVIARFESPVKPDSPEVTAAIEKALK